MLVRFIKLKQRYVGITLYLNLDKTIEISVADLKITYTFVIIRIYYADITMYNILYILYNFKM
jgi:hypothetical protein